MGYIRIWIFLKSCETLLKSSNTTESLRLEKPSQPMEPKLCPVPTLSPAQSTECHLQPFLGHLQAWGLQTSLGSPCQGLSTLSMQKFLLLSKLSLPWHSLRPFPLVLSLFPGSTARPPLAVPSWQGVVQSHKVPPEPPFLQAEPLSQLPQPLLGLQPLPQLRSLPWTRSSPSRNTQNWTQVLLDSAPAEFHTVQRLWKTQTPV